MTLTSRIDDDLREHIIAKPHVILDDTDVMRALIAGNEQAVGENVVDLRSIAMDRLETRLDQLEDTHRSVIAAAYENLAGTNQVHRAILSMLSAARFEDFLANLGGEVATILQVDAVRLVLENSPQQEPTFAPHTIHDVLTITEPGFILDYLGDGRRATPRAVTLRAVDQAHVALYGDKAAHISSEACLLLDVGPGRQAGLLVFGSEDPHMFSPQQGGDLLSFFAGVFERALRRWLT